MNAKHIRRLALIPLLALGAAAPAVAADVAEYRQWLGASGAQHVILDDYAPTYKATVVLSAAMNNVAANQSIFCCRSGTGGQYTYKTFSLFYRTDVGLRFDYNVTEGRFKGPKLTAGGRFTVVVSGADMIVNGSTRAAQALQDFVPGEGKGHLSIFATHRNGDTEEVGAYANMALYSMKIYDTVDGADGVLVKDLHPCVDTDGAYGLYDTVSGRIYYNDATTGSGTFSISPVVVDVNGNPVGGDAGDAADVAEYRQWLGANGQYLLLDDFAPSARATIVAHASLNRVSGGNMTVFCCRYGDYIKNTFTLFYLPGTGFRFDYGNATKFSGPAVNAAESFTIVASGTNYIVNGVSKATGAFADFIPGGGVCHLVLFASNLNGDTLGLGNYADIKLYSFKVYDTVGGVDGVLARDLHPCVDTDGKYGLYDTVSGRIYYAAAGSFAISPVEVDVNGNPVGDTSAFDHPAGGAFVWDNATGALANWTNAWNWTAKDGYPGLAAATATFGSATPEAIVSLGGANITSKWLYVSGADVTLTNGHLRSGVDITGSASGAPARLAVARGVALDSANGASRNWNLRGSNIAVDIQGAASNVTMDAFGPVQGTNVLFRVDGGTLVGANAPMMDTCTNFQFEVVNGGEARLGGRWVYQYNIAQTWKPARSGYAAKEGGVLVHNGGYGIPLVLGEENYLVVSNAAFGTSQNSMQLTLGAKENFADFHNAQIGVDGAKANILFQLTGVGNRLGFSGTLQLVPQQCQFSATGRDGTVDFNQNGYAYILQAGITGSNNTFRVGRDAAVYVERLIDMANATNALVEVCGFCTNDAFRATFTIRNGSRLFVNGGTFRAMRDTGGLVVTNGGVVAVAGESALCRSNFLYARAGGTLEFTLPETPWAAAPVTLGQTAVFSDGAKIRVNIGDYKPAGWVEIPLVHNFSQPADLDSLLEVGKGLSERSYLEIRSKVLYLHTKAASGGTLLMVQ